MPVVSLDSRKSLVELYTSDGSFYVRPSGWARIYLLWTFRNFHRLPEKVLNRRQLRLIEGLCRTALVAADRTIPRSCILGVVENVRLKAVSRIAAMPASEHIQTAARAPVISQRAVGAELIGMPPNMRDREPINCEPCGGRTAKLGRISLSQQRVIKVGPDPVASITYRTHRRGTLMFAAASASTALLLVTLIYVRTDRQLSLKAASQAALKAPPPVSDLANSLAHPERPRGSFAPGEREQAARIPATKSPVSTSSSTQTQSTQAKPDISPDANVDSSLTEHLLVAGAPQRAFAYPVAPNPSLSGKVRLKARIGADGTVTNVEVLSGNPSLARAAVGAVRHWRYRPYEINGQWVEAETNVTISFVGDEAVSVTFPETHAGLDSDR